jgi:hypothetical protein
LRRALVAAAPAVVACGVLSATPAAAQWSTSSVFTDDGVEIGVEPRLFALFALLNEAGYDKETVLGGEPILRPKFSEVREKLRGNMGRSVNKPLVEIVDKNPAPIAVYIDAVLQLGPAPRFDDKAATSPLAKALAPFIREWYNEEGGSSHLRNAVEAARETQKRLLAPTNTAIVAATKLVRLGDASEQLLEDDGGAQGRVALVLNDLDAHGALLVVQAKDTAGIIAGPFRNADDETKALDAVVFAYANTLVAAEVAKVNADGTLLATFDTVSPTTKAAYGDAKAWGKALMSCAVSREVLARAATCGALAGDAASDAALALIAPRMHEFAPTTALFAAALPELLAAPPPPPPPPPVVEEPKGKGKKK